MEEGAQGWPITCVAALSLGSWRSGEFVPSRSSEASVRSSSTSTRPWPRLPPTTSAKMAAFPKELRSRSDGLFDVLCQRCIAETLGIIKTAGVHCGHRDFSEAASQVQPANHGPWRSSAWPDRQARQGQGARRHRGGGQALGGQGGHAPDPFQEQLSNGMRAAIFTKMMPVQIQDYMCRRVEKDAKHDELKDKTLAMVGNKFAVNMGPTLMDIGEVGGDGLE
ncbi:unnamed protein product [Prorocentrum cordatum]|uniref:Uncharacterized protein n=1 Tax=Prorocentrum cordatum TaxID=2364126 RepID=A0ABN9UPW3_9DINO|nr:unnamed protein product [Polarella glacialis]